MSIFDKSDALEAVKIYQDLEVISYIDLLIGAIAKNRDFILVSRDDDFKKINGLDLRFYKI